MEVSPFLPLSDGLYIEQVRESAERLLVHVACMSAEARCPLCGTAAHRVHSRYSPQVADLPCAGRQVTLRLTVRKYFCPNPGCPRKIFAEQFPELVPSYARLTNRLRQALEALGLTTCGEVTSRLASRLGMQVAPTTLLRRIRAVPVAQSRKVRVLGVDDFGATRKVAGVAVRTLERRIFPGVLPSSAEPSLNQVRLGQCSRARQSGH
jgi:hypothetical protein